MLKAILFDMDGVLVNSEPYHREACEALSREISGGLLGAAQTHTVGISTDEMYARALKLCGKEGDGRELSRRHYAMTLEQVKRYLPRPEDALIALLQRLKQTDLRLGVVSSSPADFVAPILELYGFTELFEPIITADDAPRLKPYPDPYLIALNRLRLTPEEAIAIEDSRTGSLAAKAAGLCCVGFINPGSGKQDLSATDIQTDTYAGICAEIQRRAADVRP